MNYSIVLADSIVTSGQAAGRPSRAMEIWRPAVALYPGEDANMRKVAKHFTGDYVNPIQHADVPVEFCTQCHALSDIEVGSKGVGK
jgi:hypothetical protein